MGIQPQRQPVVWCSPCSMPASESPLDLSCSTLLVSPFVFFVRHISDHHTTVICTYLEGIAWCTLYCASLERIKTKSTLYVMFEVDRLNINLNCMFTYILVSG